MTITLGDLAKDPSLIEKLRSPFRTSEDPDDIFEDDTFFEELGEEIEKRPIGTPGLRRG